MMGSVRQQYEKWVYPIPLHDLDEAARAGHNDYSDPTLFRRKFWPKPIEPENLRVLVAGCGTSQAAWHAYRNLRYEVVGVDISESSLAHQNILKEKHGLSNLRLHRLSVLDVGQLGESFDFIVSTGVLHHLPDPDAGLRALKGVLAPHGVMSIMVYGWYRRFGVYMLQEAFRLLGVEQTTEGVALVRETLDAVPSWHHVKSYSNTAPDLHYDAGIVDTFLHPVDRSFTVKQVLRFASENGLHFQDWLDRISYSVSALIPAALPLYTRAARLSFEDQWQLVELLGQSLGSHRFILCHPERDPKEYTIDFSDENADGWLSYIPHLRPPITVARLADFAQGTTAVLKRFVYEFNLDDREGAMFELVNGERTIGQIVQAYAAGPQRYKETRNAAFRLFARMHDWDHLMFQL